MKHKTASKTRAQRGTSPVASGALVRLLMPGWRLFRPRKGWKKFIHTETQSWVTTFENNDWCHCGYRGNSLGRIDGNPEYCLREIDAMLHYFVKPNTKL